MQRDPDHLKLRNDVYTVYSILRFSVLAVPYFMVERGLFHKVVKCHLWAHCLESVFSSCYPVATKLSNYTTGTVVLS